jgi:hypothetical protein
MNVLLTKQSGSGINRGFRSIDNQVYTYRFPVDSFTAKFILCTKTKVGLATQGNHSIPGKFGLKQTRRPLVVGMSKKTIRLDLSMQIGCFVYQYAKLRMLEFYYDHGETNSSFPSGNAVASRV